MQIYYCDTCGERIDSRAYRVRQEIYRDANGGLHCARCRSLDTGTCVSAPEAPGSGRSRRASKRTAPAGAGGVQGHPIRQDRDRAGFRARAGRRSNARSRLLPAMGVCIIMACGIFLWTILGRHDGKTEIGQARDGDAFGRGGTAAGVRLPDFAGMGPVERLGALRVFNGIQARLNNFPKVGDVLEWPFWEKRVAEDFFVANAIGTVAYGKKSLMIRTDHASVPCILQVKGVYGQRYNIWSKIARLTPIRDDYLIGYLFYWNGETSPHGIQGISLTASRDHIRISLHHPELADPLAGKVLCEMPKPATGARGLFGGSWYALDRGRISRLHQEAFPCNIEASIQPQQVYLAFLFRNVEVALSGLEIQLP